MYIYIYICIYIYIYTYIIYQIYQIDRIYNCMNKTHKPDFWGRGLSVWPLVWRKTKVVLVKVVS